MRVELKIDKNLEEDKVTIEAKEKTEEIENLYNKILNNYQKLECYIETERYFSILGSESRSKPTCSSASRFCS